MPTGRETHPIMPIATRPRGAVHPYLKAPSTQGVEWGIGESVMHRALTMSRWGKCGSDTALTSRSEVEAMAMMDRQDSMAHLDLSESAMYTASTLHLHWMLFDYASFESMDPSNTCPLCKAAFSDPLCPEPLNKHLFTWHAQMGGCEGHDKCLQAHEIAKLGIKRLAVCKPDLGGATIF